MFLTQEEKRMAMTNAERQARFREHRKAQGLKRKDTWINTEGFQPIIGKETTTRTQVDYNQFIRDLKIVIEPMPEFEAEAMYAELLDHARQLREYWNRIDAAMRPMVEEEK
jgi:hypothetical protein